MHQDPHLCELYPRLLPGGPRAVEKLSGVAYPSLPMLCGQVEKTLDESCSATQRGRLENRFRKSHRGRWSLRGDRWLREHEPGGGGVPPVTLARLTASEVREDMVDERRLGDERDDPQGAMAYGEREGATTKICGSHAAHGGWPRWAYQPWVLVSGLLFGSATSAGDDSCSIANFECGDICRRLVVRHASTPDSVVHSLDFGPTGRRQSVSLRLP